MSIQQPLNFLQQIEPFSELPSKQLEMLAAAMDVVYFPLKTVFEISGASSAKESAALYFVIKGHIAEFDSEQRLRAIYAHQTYFGETVLLGKETSLNYEVKEEAIVYKLSRNAFLEALKDKGLANYFNYNLTEKLQAFHQKIQIQSASESLMGVVSDAPLQSMALVNANDSIRKAILTMTEAHVDACVVAFEAGVGDGFGIVTSMDLLASMSKDDQVTLESPVGAFAHRELVTVHQLDYLFNALLKMTKYHLNRLVVRDDTKPVAVLHQKDLMSVFASQSGMAVFEIQQAGTIGELKKVAKQIDELVLSLHTKGVKTHYIAKLVNELHRKMISRVLELLDSERQFTEVTFVVMGSEGRAEQVIRTDQDNALILKMPAAKTPGLVVFVKQVHQALIELGFPECPGNIMVSNPVWTQTVGEYKEQIKNWMLAADEQSFMYLSILFDAEAVSGDTDQLQEVKHSIFHWVENHPEFLRYFAKPVLQFETPVGFFGQLVTEKRSERSEIDLKKGGIFPIVHGIRCLALEKGIQPTNTHWRIKALMDQGFFSSEFGIELGETLNYLNTLRLRSMLDQIQLDRQPDNFVQLDKLSQTQQDLLKDAFKVVERFKKLIDHHFKIHTVL